MKIFKAGIILCLLALIFGGVWLFYYVAFWKPNHLVSKEQKSGKDTSSAAATPTPDFTVSAFEKAMNLIKAGNMPDGRQALREFITTHPQSSKIKEAKKTLSDINTTEFFSLAPSPDKTAYTVVAGDSLARIASRLKTSPELIFQINNLMNINLRIGQELMIPKPEVSLSIDKKNQVLTVLNHGQFFKEYPILSLKSSNLPVHGSFAAKVMDKFAMQEGKRLAFGEKSYFGSDRYIILSQGGIMIRAAPPNISPDQMPAGIILAPSDLEEMFSMINRGTPVIIQ